MSGSTYSGILGASAECRDCGWTTEARNAMGNAKQHADRTGHNVWVEQTIGVSYNDPRGLDESREEGSR